MATYDYTSGTQAQSCKGLGFHASNHFYKVQRKFDVATVIAWNSTLTTNAKITSADVFKIIAVPDDTLALMSGFKIITAFAACNDIDIGKGGGDELQDGADPTATAGGHAITLVGDDYGANSVMGYVFTSADTIDLTFQADETSGEILIYALLVDVADDEETD